MVVVVAARCAILCLDVILIPGMHLQSPVQVQPLLGLPILYSLQPRSLTIPGSSATKFNHWR